ncbi:ubiquitin interaction motif protein [Phlyctema vagabunda]|uniref:Ubiquitin interaction motif protein n=1 Tax=Phlyctema vagabunda TaxID=108571 RepID=A0ABR4PS64_9HELO
MAAQPTEEDIDTLMNVTCHSFSRSEAIARLKGNNNDTTQAVHEFFDDPESTRYCWDDSQFSSDRDGGYEQKIPSFNVQGPDTFYQPGPAPSRPPSRSSNNRSPNSAIDLTDSHSAANALTSMSQADLEDAQMAQAMAESRADAMLPPQVSGTTDTEGVYFGPAMRPENETREWQIVPHGSSSAQEMILDPEPPQRKRKLGVPAFLKPTPNGSRLGALLTIYHEIPVARETFLDRNQTLSDYGYDKEWWTGRAMETAIICDEDEGFKSNEAELFCSELQRLMAFLDATDRSYGSAEVLTEFHTMRLHREREDDTIDMVCAFFNTWKEFLSGSKDLERLFTVGVTGQQQDADQREFALFTLELPHRDSTAETIYDLADGLLWAGVPIDIGLASIPYLSHVANVVAFHVTGGQTSKNILIPSVWYPDRYLESSRLAAAGMREKQMQIHEELDKISRIEEKLTYINRGTGGRLKVKEVLESALRHDEAQLSVDNLLADGNGKGPDVEMEEAPKQYDISAEIHKLIASIDSKLLALNEQKNKTREALRQASGLLTEPSDDPNQPELHPYSLRGVSTTSNTTYVCRQSEPNLIDMDISNEGGPSSRDEWWKIHFATSGSDPRTDLDKVLEAAMTESKSAILVYADSAAMQWPSEPAPVSLQNFVRADNLAFSEEFPELEDPPAQSDSPLVDPKSPSKRKYQSSEEESLNSTKGISSLRRGSSTKSSDGATTLADRSVTPKPDEEGVIVGIDPFQVVNESGKGQEMKERGGMRMSMMAGATGGREVENHSMDIDQVLEDADSREESAAVKKVGFVE